MSYKERITAVHVNHTMALRDMETHNTGTTRSKDMRYPDLLETGLHGHPYAALRVQIMMMIL